MENNETIADYNKLLFDPKFRKNIRNNPNEHATLLGYGEANKEDIKYVVKTNTKKIVYIILLDDTSLNIDEMKNFQAASNLRPGSVSSASSLGSVGCVTACISTASSTGSVGSIGTTKS